MIRPVNHRRRPGVTLMEVLIAIFVMSIGLLCVLTLFVLGAQRMATAFKDGSAAQAAICARGLANMKDLRNIKEVTDALGAGADSDPSNPVFIDPIGAVSNGPRLGSNIDRVSPAGLSDHKYFSLLDDINFQRGSGTPKRLAGSFEREINTTWAYMAQRDRKSEPATARLTVCIFQRRLKAGGETVISNATMDPTTNTIAIPRSKENDEIRPGSWVLDASKTASTTLANFYRITAIREVGGNRMFDLQTSLQGHAASEPGEAIIFDGLAEVVELGTAR